MNQELAYITITHSTSGLRGKNYGPLTVVAARQKLHSSGWIEMLSGSHPYWYARTGPDEGMNAEIKIISLFDPKLFPHQFSERGDGQSSQNMS